MSQMPITVQIKEIKMSTSKRSFSKLDKHNIRSNISGEEAQKACLDKQTELKSRCSVFTILKIKRKKYDKKEKSQNHTYKCL